MENAYFKPNAALQAASNVQDRLVGQQQAQYDREAMEIVAQTAELQEADRLMQQREMEAQGLGTISDQPIPVMPDTQAGLGII